MKKLTKVVLMFDDGSEVSMEAAKEINMNIKTEFPEPLHFDPDKPTRIDILSDYLAQEQATTVTIDFVLSKVAINGDKQLTESIAMASATKSNNEPIPLSDWLPKSDDGTTLWHLGGGVIRKNKDVLCASTAYPEYIKTNTESTEN